MNRLKFQWSTAHWAGQAQLLNAQALGAIRAYGVATASDTNVSHGFKAYRAPVIGVVTCGRGGGSSYAENCRALQVVHHISTFLQHEQRTKAFKAAAVVVLLRWSAQYAGKQRSQGGFVQLLFQCELDGRESRHASHIRQH